MKRLLHRAPVLDEREMQEMYRIDHAGFWGMYVLLCLAVIVQMLLGAPLSGLAGELLVLGAVSAGMIVAYARKGFWDESSRPSRRGNAAYSAACAAGVALVVTAIRRSVAWGVFSGAAMFCLCFALLSLMTAYLARRQSREEAALDEESGDEIDS